MPDKKVPTSSTLELLERMGEGDEAAGEELYARLLPRLRRWARGRLPREEGAAFDTDDIVQETLLRTLSGLKAFDPQHSGALQAYLCRTISNRAADEVKSRRRQPRRDGRVSRVVDPGPSQVEAITGREVLDAYNRGLKSLSDDEREAVVGRIELGLKYKELAAALGKPTANAARMMVSRALVKLSKKMAELGPAEVPKG